jgi:hypothetical protein
MPWSRTLGRLTFGVAAAALCACATGERLAKAPERYIDLRFPVVSRASAQFPHVVDAEGALWYIDGDRIVRAASPGRDRVTRDPDARAGTLFWYDGAVFVLNGDGTRLERLSDASRDPVTVPSAYAPAEGVIADARHEWLVLPQSRSSELAVIDKWKWYGERIPAAIDPLEASLAGGAHGKKYLVVADAHRPIVAIKNRWNGRSVVVRTPDNGCFAGSRGAWDVPVDVRGRDGYRVWASAGEHVASIDLLTKKTLRVWDLDGCALHILRAGGDSAIVMTAQKRGTGFSSALVRVDRDGVHALDEYGHLDGLAGGASLDRYDRLWWYDAKQHAFVCRTPLDSG